LSLSIFPWTGAIYSLPFRACALHGGSHSMHAVVYLAGGAGARTKLFQPFGSSSKQPLSSIRNQSAACKAFGGGGLARQASMLLLWVPSSFEPRAATSGVGAAGAAPADLIHCALVAQQLSCILMFAHIRCLLAYRRSVLLRVLLRTRSWQHGAACWATSNSLATSTRMGCLQSGVC